MRKPRKTDMDKEQYWRKVLREFQASEMPFRKFCEANNISPNTFQYWRKRIRELDAERGVQTTIRTGENRRSVLQEKAEYWLEMIDEANVFAGSISKFCREKEISSGTLYQWEKRLKGQGLTAGLRKSTEPEPKLIPVRITEGGVSKNGDGKQTLISDDSRIEIRLHDGNRVY